MANKEKQIGNSPLLGIPKSRLNFVVKDGSITLDKLAAEVLNLINSSADSSESPSTIGCIDLAQAIAHGDTITDSEIENSVIVYDTYNRILEYARILDPDTSERNLLFKVCYTDGTANYRQYIVFDTDDPSGQDSSWTFSRVISEDSADYLWAMSVFGDAMIQEISSIPVIAVSESSITFNGVIGQTYTKDITATVYNFSGDIDISSTGDGDDNVFSISSTVLSRSDTACVIRITVTYVPTVNSQYKTDGDNATIVLSSGDERNTYVTLAGHAEAESSVDMTHGYYGTSMVLPSSLSGTMFVIGSVSTISVIGIGMYVWVIVPKNSISSITAINSSKDEVTVYSDSTRITDYVIYYWATGFTLDNEEVTFTIT